MTHLFPVSEEEFTIKLQQVFSYLINDKHLLSSDLFGVNKIIKTWKENKNSFLINSKFQGFTVIELGEVNVKLDQTRKNELIDKFLDTLDDKWTDTFPEYEEYADDARKLWDFYYNNRASFFDNKTSNPFEAPDGTIISYNSKISKSIKHFFDNPTLVRMIQDKYSELIQQDKVNGILCASIHPLDYLSISENNYNWRSCHALNGEYANGNLSYMLDNCTIIFYIKSKDEVKLPRFPKEVPWNDKKWRMLVFIDPDKRFMFAGRQYPFFSQELLDKVGEFLDSCYIKEFMRWSNFYLQDIFFEYDGFEYDIELPEKYLISPDKNIFTRQALIADADGSTHYDDLLYSHCYIPFYRFDKHINTKEIRIEPMIIGHKPICPKCGKKQIMPTRSFMCEECYGKLYPVYCKCCNKELSYQSDTPRYLAYYGMVCGDCYGKHTRICPKCHSILSDRELKCFCELALVSELNDEYIL